MTGPEVQRAVLQFPLDGERVWLSFDSPRRTILANELGDVPAAMKAAEAPEPTTEAWDIPIDVEPVPSGHEFLFHKTTVREVYDNALARFPGAPDVLLWNEVGELTETTIGNLVVELDGRLVTPPVACGLLPGTFRAQLLADGEVVELAISRSDLDRAAAVWMVNSVRGWFPIVPVTDTSTVLNGTRRRY